MQQPAWRLMLVSHKQCTSTQNYLAFIENCVAHGVSAVQLREKALSYPELRSFARQLQQVLHKTQTPLIINDHVSLCHEIDAAGVHLGQGDGCVIAARQLLGPNKIIGLSVNCLEQIKQANHLPIDYIGIGAVFPTQHKPDIETVWGLTGLATACQLARRPAVAIGGITPANAASVISCGVHGIAAIGAFHAATDPSHVAHQFHQHLLESPHVRAT